MSFANQPKPYNHSKTNFKSKNYYRQKQKRRDVGRINDEIDVKEVRLIGEDGEMIGVTNTEEAIEKAKDIGLDLIEISPNANPPVCKIIGYGKYAYQLEKKKREAKKHQKVVHLKEIKLRPKTDVHDYNFKVKHICNFLKAGDRVKVSIHFRGREMSFLDVGRAQLDKIINDTTEVGKIENKPKIEGRNLFLILIPLVNKNKIENSTPKVENNATIQQQLEEKKNLS